MRKKVRENARAFLLIENEVYLLGRVRIRICYSAATETKRIAASHEALKNASKMKYLYSFYMDHFKTGDLLFFSGYGYVNSCIQLLDNTPFTSVGMILRLPNKYVCERILLTGEVDKAR